MQTLNNGDTITASGQNLMITCEYVSGTVSVSVLNSNATPILLKSFSANGATVLPGYVGTRYLITKTAGTVDVHGSCTITPP